MATTKKVCLAPIVLSEPFSKETIFVIFLRREEDDNLLDLISPDQDVQREVSVLDEPFMLHRTWSRARCERLVLNEPSSVLIDVDGKRTREARPSSIFHLVITVIFGDDSVVEKTLTIETVDDEIVGVDREEVIIWRSVLARTSDRIVVDRTNLFHTIKPAEVKN